MNNFIKENWIKFFGELIEDKLEIDNVLLEVTEKEEIQERIYPKGRFSLDEVESNTIGIFKKDRKVPSIDEKFDWDIERTTRYFPKWLCVINFYSKEDSETLDNLGRFLLDKRRVNRYILEKYRNLEGFDLFKSSSIIKVNHSDLSEFNYSTPFFHKRLTIEFIFEVSIIERIETIEIVNSKLNKKEA